MTQREGVYITYKDIQHLDPLGHFSSIYNVKKRVLMTLVDMCDQWGAPRTHEVIQTLSESESLTYRKVRYIHRVLSLHSELLKILRPGGKISESGIISRIDDRDMIVEEVDNELRIAGTYRDLVFRRA